MTKFSDRIKKSAKASPIILANDYDPKASNIESKTIRNIKLLSNYLCGIKINFHLLLRLDKKQISKINKTAHDFVFNLSLILNSMILEIQIPSPHKIYGIWDLMQ